MHKRWDLSAREFLVVIGIMELVFETLKHLKPENLHLPSEKVTFQSHMDTFCNIAEKIAKNDHVWEKLRHSSSFRRAEKGKNYQNRLKKILRISE